MRKRIGYWIVALVIFFFSYLMIRLTIPYFTFDTNVDFLLVKQNLLANSIWMWSFYLHIGFSPLVLLSGILQFNRSFQFQYPRVHRVSGYIYVFTVLVISAPTGFIMGFYANGGWPARVSFILISLLWWFWTFRAVTRIRKRFIDAHKADMLRSYALCLSAITLRLYVYVLPMMTDLRGKPMYVLVSWLSWVPNILIVEWFLRQNSTKRIHSLN